MAIISLILGIISVALCWAPIYGLVVSIVCVIATLILKRRREYGKNKRIMKVVALVIAIAGLVVSIFVTGVHVTETAIETQTNEAALNDVRGSVNAATLLQAQQQAEYAWNEARMKGLKNEKMEQYIFDAIKKNGIDTTNMALEITKTGVTVKMK